MVKISGIPSEFVIVSGDSDIQTAIDKIVKCGFRVHVWAWDNCMAGEYRRQTEELVHVHYLDPYLDQITYHNRSRGDRYSPPLISLNLESKARGIGEFLPRSEHQYSSALEGLDGLDEIQKPRAAAIILNRFYLLSVDTSGDQGDYTPLAVNNSNAKKTELGDASINIVVDPKPTLRKEQAKGDEVKSQRRCNFRKYCSKGMDCTFGHTDGERKWFRIHGPARANKLELCRHEERSGCNRGAYCDFAHGESELFCPTCGKTGAHNMLDCPECTRNGYRRTRTEYLSQSTSLLD
ncbi:hypothetical protein N658DRAFT_39608 [Parathielavia hyrcaniae]|uniref:C3H1-type domain-containing protein n=1 Tax=Parathielavia hyrcaniae TaxID=113614 RepID=A0AAN6Q6V4_9PEZI|nr:hypothetical protein N658DRAFT_39608 [Parathielavia hyrcaniae]